MSNPSFFSLLPTGIHSRIIVPPSWIVKLPRKGSFKSSLRKTPKKKPAGKKKSKEKELRTFVIKPIPTPNVTPVVVFINPKSGGNQGAKLLQKFQWLLNPRQVFDLTQGGPKMGYVCLLCLRREQQKMSDLTILFYLQFRAVSKGTESSYFSVRRWWNCRLGTFRTRSNWHIPATCCWRFTARNWKWLGQSSWMGWSK